MYFMATLMNQVGFDQKQSVFMLLVGGGSLLLGTIPAIFYMESFGRRFWACAMLPGFLIGLLIIGCSYLSLVSDFSMSAGVYITGLIIYEGFFGSYACLTWVLPSEVYPTYLRSYGVETSDVTLFFCSWLVTYFFADMQRAISKIGLHWVSMAVLPLSVGSTSCYSCPRPKTRTWRKSISCSPNQYQN